MEKEEVMKMVCNLQRRIWNCGGIVVELFGRNQLWVVLAGGG
jgi:hypothetical protein